MKTTIIPISKHISMVTSPLFLLGKEQFLKLLPQNTEQNSLQSISEDLCLQSSEHQPSDSTLLQDILDNLRITNLCWVRLLVHFADSNGVGTSVADCRRTESQERTSTQLCQLSILLGDLFAQIIVGKEPRIVADECSRCCGKGSIVKSTWASG